MKISIIGLGIVGKACLKGFKKLQHKCIGIDLHNLKSLSSTVNSDIIYLCLPVPLKKNGVYEQNLINNYLKYFSNLNYKGIIAIKSTLEPGSTDKYKKKYKKLKICFVPEFLRERKAFSDFMNHHDLLLVGTNDKKIYRQIRKSHGSIPKKSMMTNPKNAELIKIFSNSYNAYRVLFANIFFELSKKLKIDYENFLLLYLKRNNSSGNYLKCNKNLRGFAGTCLPKDIIALNSLLKKYKLSFKTVESVINDNNSIKKTVFKGMRYN